MPAARRSRRARALLVLGAVGAWTVFEALLVGGHGFAEYDSAYELVWGRELMLADQRCPNSSPPQDSAASGGNGPRAACEGEPRLILEREVNRRSATSRELPRSVANADPRVPRSVVSVTSPCRPRF